MDTLERIAEPDGYRRVELAVVSADGSEELVVYVYVKQIEHLVGVQIQSETIDEYKLEHSTLYRGRNP